MLRVKNLLVGLVSVVILAGCGKTLIDPSSDGYTVTYQRNGATGGVQPNDPGTYTTGQTVVVKGNTGSLAKTGCSFGGWSLTANGSGTAFQDGQTIVIPDHDMSLFAVWIPLSAQISDFSFNGIVGQTTITGTTITVQVPFGTSLVSLIAEFTTVGVSVAVGGVAQTSGVTTNDFSAPVTYVVTGADGSTVSYIVTVNVLGSVTLGSQNGSIHAGNPETATFSITSTDIPDGTTGNVTWYASPTSTNVTSAPTGITEALGAIANGSATLTITAANPSVTVAGSYYFKVKYGTASSAMTMLTILQNPAAPVVTISDPTGSMWLNTNVFNATGTAVPVSGSTITSLTYTLDGTVGAPVTGSLTSWTIPVTTVGNGTHTLQVTATGSNSQTGSATVTINIDTLMPAITGLASDKSWYKNGQIASVVCSATDAESGIQSLEFRIDSGSWVSGGSTGGGNYSCNITLAAYAEGTHTIHARATDKVGNVSSTSCNVYVDNTAPTIAGLLADQTYYRSSQSASVTCSAADLGSGIQSVNFRIDTGSWISGVSGGGGNYTCSIPVSGLSQGPHIIYAEATDNVGYVSNTVNYGMYVDDSAPAITSMSAINPGSFNSSYAKNGDTVQVTVVGVSDAGSGILSVDFRLDSGSWISGAYAGGGNYTCSMMISGIDGTHTISARATDYVGNVSSTVSCSILVDNTAPAISQPTFLGGYLEGENVPLLYTLADASGIYSFVVAVVSAGGTEGNFTGTVGGGVTVTMPSNPGNYWIAAAAYDAAGNSTTVTSTTFTIP